VDWQELELNAFIAIAVKIDNRNFTRQREKKGGKSYQLTGYTLKDSHKKNKYKGTS
jgi:hypothetical protein